MGAAHSRPYGLLPGSPVSSPISWHSLSLAQDQLAFAIDVITDCVLGMCNVNAKHCIVNFVIVMYCNILLCISGISNIMITVLYCLVSWSFFLLYLLWWVFLCVCVYVCMYFIHAVKQLLWWILILQFYLHTCPFFHEWNEPYLPLPYQPKLVLVYWPWRDGRLSWPRHHHGE